MTVVIADSTGMCSDSLISDGQGYQYQQQKLFTNGEWCIGVAGNLANAMIFVDWWENKKSKHLRDLLADQKDDWEALVYDPANGLQHYTRTLHPDPVLQDVYAIGSGGSVAFGAYKALGKYSFRKKNMSLLQLACTVAIECGQGCGGELQYVKFGT